MWYTYGALDMLFHIEPSLSIPIYEQIVSQVIFGVASGTLRVGELIPSVRELGENLVVHPNTVARAYQELERQGVVTARRGRGMEVTQDGAAICLRARQEIVRTRIRDALREAASSALDPDDIRRLVDEELLRVNGKKH
jgi:GntR family transcriptional regulator